VGDREVGQCLDGSVILTLEIQQTFCAACKTGVNPELLEGLPMKPRPIDALLQWITLLQCPGAGMDVQQRSAVTHLALYVVMTQAALHGYWMIDFQRA